MKTYNVLLADLNGQVIDSVEIELDERETKIALIPVHDMHFVPGNSAAELKTNKGESK